MQTSEPQSNPSNIFISASFYMGTCLGVLGRLFRIGKRHSETSNKTSTGQKTANCSDVLERCGRDKYCLSALFMYHLCGRVIDDDCYRKATLKMFKLKSIYDPEDIEIGWPAKLIAQTFIKINILEYHKDYAMIRDEYMRMIDEIYRVCSREEIVRFIESNMVRSSYD